MDISKALEFGWPGSSWTLNGNDYSGLVWHDTKVNKPSISEIETKYQEFRTATDYINNRKSAYKTIEAQLDMMYWDQVNSTTLWRDHIASVKAAYPKPQTQK